MKQVLRSVINHGLDMKMSAQLVEKELFLSGKFLIIIIHDGKKE